MAGRIDTTDLRKLAVDAKLAAGELPGKLKRAVTTASAITLGAARVGMPVYTGEGANALHARGLRVEELPGGVRYSDSVFGSTVQNIVMETGRFAGETMPPVEPIRRWVQLKVGRGQLDISWTGKEGDAAIDSATFALRVAIARRGITPRLYMEAAERAGREALELELRAIRTELARRIG